MVAFTCCTPTHEIRKALLHSLQYSYWTRCASCPSSVSLAHQTLGTNYGFGWHVTDMSPYRYIAYNEVQNSRHLFRPCQQFSRTSGSLYPQSSISSVYSAISSPSFFSTSASLAWKRFSDMPPGQSCSSSLVTYSATF